MKPAIQDLAAQFERETGHKLVSKFASGPLVKQEIKASGLVLDAIAHLGVQGVHVKPAGITKIQ